MVSKFNSMNKVLYSGLILFFLISMPGLIAQEEFFGKCNGLSLLYSNINPNRNNNIATYGMSYFWKAGIGVSAGTGYSEGSFIPMASIIFLARPEGKLQILRPFAGFSYANLFGKHLFDLQTGILANFFMNSQFPLSLDAAISIQFGESSIPMAGIGYTQAFMAQERVYPVVNVSYTGGFLGPGFRNEEFIGYPAFGVGFNVKIGKSEEKAD